MTLDLQHIQYSALNARQKENFNYQKVSAILADYGFVTMRLSDDWQGADFIAMHIDGNTVLRVQLKGRLDFNKKYVGKDLYVAFSEDNRWYLFPHDEVLEMALAQTGISTTKSWEEKGNYNFPAMTSGMRQLLSAYELVGGTRAITE